MDNFSPAAWFERLLSDLGGRQKRYELLDRYYRSDPPLPPGPEVKKRSEALDYLRKTARVNWAELIVESLVERMEILGFNAGSTASPEFDQLLVEIWQANDLDTFAPILHRTKATLGEAYTIIGEGVSGPVITCEDPRQVVAVFDPGKPRRESVAALKVFADPVAGIDRGFLFLPGVVHRLERPRKPDAAFSWSARGWEFVAADELYTPRVPVVWHPNRPNLAGVVQGEFETVLDDLNRIMLLILQRLQVAVMQAFRQRAVKGDLPEKDEAGNLINYDVLFSSDPAALWNLPNGVELWESAGVDLTPILESVKADIEDLAGRARVPFYYLRPSASPAAAEGTVAQREGLIFRAKSRIREASGPWEQTMSLACEAAGLTLPGDAEVIWQHPDRATLAEKADAAVKALAAGIPWRSVMADVWQATPAAIERMAAQRPLDAV